METYLCFAFLTPTIGLLLGLAFLMGGV